MAGFSIMQAWIAMLVRPELPMAIVEERIGEGSVFVIDRYEVRSWPELEAALAAQGDVAGSREGGWERFVIDEDGRPQELTAILVEPDRSEITLVHPKGTPPDPGRAWFEAIVGAAVVFLSSEMGDFDGRPHAL